MFTTRYKWVYEDVVDRILDGGLALDSHIRCLGKGAQFVVDAGRLVAIQEEREDGVAGDSLGDKPTVVRVVSDLDPDPNPDR